MFIGPMNWRLEEQPRYLPRVDDDGGDDDDDDLLLRSWRLEEPPRYFSRSQTGCRSP